MKESTHKSLFLSSAVAALFTLTACQKPEQSQGSESRPVEELATLDQKVTYIKSYKLVKRGTQNGVVFDEKVMARAIYDAKNGIPSKIPDSEHVSIMNQLKKEFDAKKVADRAAKGVEDAKIGAEFLANNAKKEGVVVTESGLQYKVLNAVEAKGVKAKPEDLVRVHYKGSLLDGTVFKNTAKKPKGVDFILNSVIAGWVEGIQLMNVGEKFEFFVPSELAYGEEGTSSIVGPNATLKFEVELLEINPDIEAEKAALQAQRKKKAEQRAEKRKKAKEERANKGK